MFGDGSLTFREFAMREPLPLATIHDAVLEFLRGRTDAVLCGAHAVNAYVDVSRMTDDVDIMSSRAGDLAEEVRAFLVEQTAWNPMRFVDLCEAALHGRSTCELLCRRIQRAEWQLLFDYCFRHAANLSQVAYV